MVSQLRIKANFRISFKFHKMPVLKEFDNRKGYFLFNCPGCKTDHYVNTNPEWGTAWDWNKSYDKPTIHPSILVGARGEVPRCHSFIKEGRIQFLGDCDHELKNQTADLPKYNFDFDFD